MRRGGTPRFPYRPPDWADGLKACRVTAGLTQREVAARAGLKPKYYEKLENGEKPFAKGSIDRVLDAIGVTLFDVQAARDACPWVKHRKPPPAWPWWAERPAINKQMRQSARKASYEAGRAVREQRAQRRAAKRAWQAKKALAADPLLPLKAAVEYQRKLNAQLLAQKSVIHLSTNHDPRATIGGAWRPSASRTTSETT